MNAQELSLVMEGLDVEVDPEQSAEQVPGADAGFALDASQV